MPSIVLLNQLGQQVGELTLSENVFAVENHQQAVFDTIVAERAAMRQGTQKAKTRSEVSGGGRKPWRQKGTGNARHDEKSAPQFVGGGVVFAPKPRDFSKKMNLTAKRVAMFSALSQKIRDDEVIFVDSLVSENGKTKEMVAFLKSFNLEKTVLFVMDNADVNVLRASSNIKAISTIPVEQINTYDIVKNAKVVITKDAVKKIEEAYEV